MNYDKVDSDQLERNKMLQKLIRYIIMHCIDNNQLNKFQLVVKKDFDPQGKLFEASKKDTHTMKITFTRNFSNVVYDQNRLHFSHPKIGNASIPFSSIISVLADHDDFKIDLEMAYKPPKPKLPDNVIQFKDYKK